MLFRSVAAFFLLALSANAQLAWQQVTAFIYAEPGDPAQLARFPFKNTGDHALTIKSLKADCGCTAASLEKKTYQPGESGEVDARFMIGDRKGVYLTHVTVLTDEPNAQPVTLQLQPIIRPLAELKPTLLFWKTGEAREPKRIQLTPSEGQKVIEFSAVADSDAVSVQPSTANGDFALIVKPDAKAQKARATIQVTVKLQPGGTRTYKVYARIQ